MTLTMGLALYAAFTSTVAVTLSLRKWFVTGPRLALRIMARATAMDGDDTEFVLLTVTNRGDLPTTLSLMAAFQFKTVFHRWRRRPYWAAIVPRPAMMGGPSTPCLLSPGTEWSGAAKYDEQLLALARSGRLFIGIHAGHRQRVYVARVRWKETEEEATRRLAEASA